MCVNEEKTQHLSGLEKAVILYKIYVPLSLSNGEIYCVGFV